MLPKFLSTPQSNEGLNSGYIPQSLRSARGSPHLQIPQAPQRPQKIAFTGVGPLVRTSDKLRRLNPIGFIKRAYDDVLEEIGVTERDQNLSNAESTGMDVDKVKSKLSHNKPPFPSLSHISHIQSSTINTSSSSHSPFLFHNKKKRVKLRQRNHYPRMRIYPDDTFRLLWDFIIIL
jgi:hypothetical protein